MADNFSQWDHDGDVQDGYNESPLPWQTLHGSSSATIYTNDNPDGHEWSTGNLGNSSAHPNQPSSETPFGEQFVFGSANNPFVPYQEPLRQEHLTRQLPIGSDTYVKHENDDEDYVSVGDDDDTNDETYAEHAGKKRKVNKDGTMRKVRQPRGHLRNWDMTDFCKALLTIVWACGENGVQIPFEQAARMIDQSCSASALQQAILKLHARMNEDGHQIPRIKMNWPKKAHAVTDGTSVVRDNGKVPRKKMTLTQSTQTSIHTIRLPKGTTLNEDGLKYEIEISSPAQAATLSTQHFGPPSQYTDIPQGLAAGSQRGQAGVSGTTEIKQEEVDGLMSHPGRSLAQAQGPPATPVQPARQLVCPSPPHPRRVVRRFDVDPPMKASPSPSLTNLWARHIGGTESNNTSLGPLNLFNAEFGQGHSQGLRQQPQSTLASRDCSQQQGSRSSNGARIVPELSWHTTMPHRALFANDLDDTMSPFSTMGNSPYGVTQLVSAERSTLGLGAPNGLHSPFSMGTSSNGLQSPFLMGHPSNTSGIDATRADPRKDSVYASGPQSSNSSQADLNRCTDEALLAANASFQAKIAAATNRSMTSTPARTTQRAHPRQQRQQRQQPLSLGLDTLENPFGGTFGDHVSPMDLSNGDFENLFDQQNGMDYGFNP